MITLADLLAQKQRLIERLHDSPGSEEREEIERLIEQINTALDSVEEAAPAVSKRNEQ